jgi:hypothetical protein
MQCSNCVIVPVRDSFTGQIRQLRAPAHVSTVKEFYYYLDEHDYYIERIMKADEFHEHVMSEVASGRAVLVTSPEGTKSVCRPSIKRSLPTYWD